MSNKWKDISKCSGYISLKEELKIFSQKSSYDKRRAREIFTFVISRAKHYAHAQGKTISEVLDSWEASRKECAGHFYHFYYEYNYRKLTLRKGDIGSPNLLRRIKRRNAKSHKPKGVHKRFYGRIAQQKSNCTRLSNYFTETKRRKDGKSRWSDSRKRNRQNREV